MKKLLIAAVALLVALLVAVQVSAQEPKRLDSNKTDTTRLGGRFTLPDSLAHLSPWKPDTRVTAPAQIKPAVTMTSVVVVNRENLPSRVTVINNNTLRLGQRFNLSNGQAWNNGPFQNSYLDARTLSFPGRR